jgi:copper transport protein
VVLEASVAMVVLVFSSILVASEPGRAAQAAAAGPTQADLSFDTGKASGTLSVFFSPGKVGLNQAHLYLDNSKGLPYDAAELTMQFSLASAKLGPMNATVVHDGPGHYIDTPIDLTFPGEWTLSVTIRSDDFDETTVTVPIKISP